MTRYFYIIVFFVALTLPTASFSKTEPRYLLTVEKGEVLVWPAWSSKWRRVRESARLNQETLVQIRDGATATIIDKRPSSISGITAEQIHVTIRTPSVIRLNDTNLRRIKLKPFYIDKIPEIAEQQDGEKKDFFIPLAEAWERFSVIFTGNPKDQFAAMDLAKMGETKDTELSIKTNKIYLHLPANGAIVTSDLFPIKIALQWNHKKPDKPLTYLITTWKGDEFPDKPIAMTKAKYYSLKVAEQGQYNIQITSTDNKWSSKIQTFIATLPKRSFTKNKVLADNETKLLAPPDKFNLVTPLENGKINFEWYRPELGTPREYTLVVLNKSGKELFRKNIRKQFFSAVLKPGEYTWHIESKDSVLNDNPEILVTDSRRIKVTSALKSQTAYYSQILKGSKDSVIYLEEGL